MSTIKDTLIAAALLCMGTFARGQEVGDKAYGLMLSALLSRDVPEVDVSTAATMEDAG